MPRLMVLAREAMQIGWSDMAHKWVSMLCMNAACLPYSFLLLLGLILLCNSLGRLHHVTPAAAELDPSKAETVRRRWEPLA